jgi:organic radical activating enzyme
VLTGGEPLLQIDAALLDALHARGFETALETNGTLPLPAPIDWVCVSPKAGVETVLREGDELKLVFPQPGLCPEQFEDWRFDHFFLQPMDGPRRAENTAAAVEYCLRRPKWRLSLQIQKELGIR